MTGTKLDRRTLLRGSGGIALGLPFLEIMTRGQTARAAAAGIPARFVMSFGGVSVHRGNPGSAYPGTQGPKYDVPGSFESLTKLGVRDDVTIVSGLEIPWTEQGQNNNVPPPGGKSFSFHGNTFGPQTAGTNADEIVGAVPKDSTADIIVANTIGGGTKFKELFYMMQCASYEGSNGLISFQSFLSHEKKENGRVSPVTPVTSPHQAFNDLLFGNQTPGALTPEQKRAQALLWSKKKKVADLVLEDWRRVRGILPKPDLPRFDEHIEHVNSLAGRVTEAYNNVKSGRPPSVVPGTCMLPDPGEDPPVGKAVVTSPVEGGLEYHWELGGGYSNEAKRADVLTDLIAVALGCNLTRVASYMLTEWKCYMNMLPVIGIPTDVHDATHNAPAHSLPLVISWLTEQWAKLIPKLKDPRYNEADGSRLIDHTAMLLLFEGGGGYDPEGRTGGVAHSTEEMCALVGGGGKLGLKPGHHIRAVDKHPAQVVLSAMNAVGCKTSTLGEVSGTIPQLFA